MSFFKINFTAFLSLILFSAPWVPSAWGAVRFFAFGDWGSGKDAQREVAVRTKQVCRSLGCDFGLTLGDNFYPSGVSSVSDPQWKSKFTDLYAGIKVPFFATLGNHDDQGNVQAQIDYSKINPLWIMRERNYAVRFPATGLPLVEIFIIDSDNFNELSALWLQTALSHSLAPWKFLAMHHPILNNGTRHPADQKDLYPQLKPIICKKIDLILSGHEHIFSHLQDRSDTCGWDQVIIGTGGAGLYHVKKDPPSNYKVFFSEASHGVGYFEINPAAIQFRFVRVDGSIAYQTEWKNKKPPN